jgi:hypothetical protein
MWSVFFILFSRSFNISFLPSFLPSFPSLVSLEMNFFHLPSNTHTVAQQIDTDSQPNLFPISDEISYTEQDIFLGPALHLSTTP